MNSDGRIANPVLMTMAPVPMPRVLIPDSLIDVFDKVLVLCMHSNKLNEAASKDVYRRGPLRHWPLQQALGQPCRTPWPTLQERGMLGAFGEL